MPQRIKPGDKLPFFRYDTPFAAQQHFGELVAAHPPLTLVFMSNFGHPVTRVFAERYAQTYPALRDGSFAMVVRSQPEKLAPSLPPDALPFPLICDAEGALYELLCIPQRSGTLMTCSLDGWKILRDARRRGYQPPKNAPQQLPLTLILNGEGEVQFCHYGASITDVPADCAAVQQILEALDLTAASTAEVVDVPYADDPTAADAPPPETETPEAAEETGQTGEAEPQGTQAQAAPQETPAPLPQEEEPAFIASAAPPAPPGPDLDDTLGDLAHSFEFELPPERVALTPGSGE